jgi:mannose-6-phosphate isomerase-like protein (cupin superfamily)
MEKILPKTINFKEKFNKMTEYWEPRIIAEMNNYHFKIAKIKGEFIWHRHPGSDESFIVLEGKMQIHLEDRILSLESGEMAVIPSGTEHKPVAQDECQILMIELAGTRNTGDAGGERTHESLGWI